nr:hypothetical protein [Tanacetum cinerariifolium]GEZ24921.1 hypothetical protein [Tanacetum cinerariifolium]
MFRVDRLEARGTMHRVQVQLVMRELITELGMQIQVKQGRLSATTTTVDKTIAVDEDVNEQPVQALALNMDNVFQADECEAFDSDVDESLTAQTMFMVNLSFADPVYDEAGPSYDSDILSEPYYDEQSKVAIGYKNPLCLTRVIQVHPVLYNGHEIIKTNHVPTIVYNSEDTLEIAEITRKKIKDPECVKKTVKISPHDYSKENYLATFTPQTKLTAEQIFWSKDLIKMKAEVLKEQTSASRPIKALTVYPPNTPGMLVPRMLPTKRLIEGERGFEQTKECYLTEVIPFFKTLKDHFEGIQKAPTKESKKMNSFKELEAEVDQHVINRKHAEIEQRNLLIANDNLITDCLSKDVFYTATDSVLTVSRFSDMYEAFTTAQKRIAELISENSNLQNKIQNDDHD